MGQSGDLGVAVEPTGGPNTAGVYLYSPFLTDAAEYQSTYIFAASSPFSTILR